MYCTYDAPFQKFLDAVHQSDEDIPALGDGIL